MSTIEHIGLISSVDNGNVKVRLMDDPHCHSCSMAMLCHYNDDDRSLIEVEKQGKTYKVGDEVLVMLKGTTGLLATFYAYLLPFILVVGVLSLFLSLGYSEVLSAGVSLLILVPYFLTITFMKKQIGRTVKLEIKKR